jgi:hypothetical protein
MRQRGRKSSASLSVVASVEVPRPAPPRRSSREVKALWRATTSRFRADFFSGAEPVLEAYCDGVVLLRDLLKRIEETKATEPVDYKRLAVLMQLQKSQGLLIARFASTLRLAPKAKYDRYSAAARPISTLPKPWELGGTGKRRDDDTPDGGGGSPFDAA